MSPDCITTEQIEERHQRLRWLLFGRILIISTFLGALSLVSLGGLNPYVVSTNLLFGIVAITYAFTLASAILLQRLTSVDRFAYAQVGFDLLLTTGVLYLSGGPDSPFPFLYSLSVVNAAILLQTRGAMTTALMAGAAYTVLIGGMLAGVIPSPPYPIAPTELDGGLLIRVLSNNITFFLIGGLAGSLTTRLSRTEQLLHDEQQAHGTLVTLQEALARNIGSGLVSTDPSGRVTSANDIAQQLAGNTANGLVGVDIGSVFPQLLLTASARASFLQSSSPLQPIEFTRQQPDRNDLHVRCAATPLRDTYGNAIGALYILQDVTELNQLDQITAVDDALAGMETEPGADGSEVAEPRDGLIGTSPAMREVHRFIDKVARNDATVILSGESGTGKEVVARAMHARSLRKDRAFVAINCGAIPENLIESELFGHVRGAFTGAVADRAGYFRMADGGTIFLDEIGELPVALQVKLLRVLQERVFIPVGGQAAVAVNVRVIAATNRDLAADVRAGRFREDLFYRLNVIALRLPPLRERRQDIPQLIRHFLRQFSDVHGKRVTRLSVGAAKIVLNHAFPGNVRELENIMEHAVALSDGETAHEDHLPAHLVSNGNGHSRHSPTDAPELAAMPVPFSVPSVQPDGPFDLDRDLAVFEKTALLRALDQSGGVKKRAAEILGINYRSLRHRLQKYGLESGSDLSS